MVPEKAAICKGYCGAVAVSFYSRLKDIVPELALRGVHNVNNRKVYNSTENYTEQDVKEQDVKEQDVKELIIEETLNRLIRRYETELKEIKRNYEENIGIQFDSEKTLVFIFNNGKIVTIDSLDFGVLSSTVDWK